MKRLLSVCLAAALCLGLCAGYAAAAVPASFAGACSEEEWRLLRLTNAERLSKGLSPYSSFASLQTAADTRAGEVAAQYSHTRPDGGECFTALTEAGIGYRAAAENIAAGQRTPERAVTSWISSDGHRANILDQTFAHVGVGYLAEGFLGTSWEQLFVDKDCSVSSVSVVPDAVTCAPGVTIDHLDLAVRAVCPVHGECWLPLDARMCSGFDPAKTGAQTVTVTYGGQNAVLRVNVAAEGAPDVSGADDWAKDWLKRADGLGLLSARNRSGFTGKITRLQFADLAVALAEQLTGKAVSPAPSDSFTDTEETAVLKAKTAGIASGYAAGDRFEFRPNNPITRQEICVMLAHVADYVEGQRGGASKLDRAQALSNRFADRGEVASWATAQVALMTANNVMGGKADGDRTLIAPLADTTVQEAVTLAVKLFDALG